MARRRRGRRRSRRACSARSVARRGRPGGGDVLGGAPAASRRSRASARSSWSSRTSTGPSRRCSTCSSTWPRSRRGVPILLVCLARPELLESRPAWAAPQPRPLASLVLEALGGARRAGASSSAAGAESTAAAPDRRRRPRATRCSSSSSWRSAPSRRRRRCRRASRPCSRRASTGSSRASARCCVRASVEGRTFHAGALAALLPRRRPRASRRSLALVQKQLIRPDRPEFAGEDAFRFAHALIRDAAYERLPKQLRAELHERLAGWLERSGAPPDEIVGYHLEQACRSRAELAPPGDGRARSRATRRSGCEAAAQTRARCAATPPPARALLERAVALARAGGPGPRGAAAARSARRCSTPAGSPMPTRVLAEAIARAEARDVRARVPARVSSASSCGSRPTPSTRMGRGAAGRRRRAAGARAPRRRPRPVPGLAPARADRVDRGPRARSRRRVATRRGHARRAGDERELFEVLGWRASAAVFGPTPVPEAIRRCERHPRAGRGSPVAVAVTLHPLGSLHAMTGDFEPRAAARRARRNAILDELGRHAVGGLPPRGAGRAARRPARGGRGAPAARLRGARADGRAARCSRRPRRCSPRRVYAQDRHEEAAALCASSERPPHRGGRRDPGDVARACGPSCSRRAGRLEAAEALAREARRA